MIFNDIQLGMIRDLPIRATPGADGILGTSGPTLSSAEMGLGIVQLFQSMKFYMFLLQLTMF